MRKTRKQLKEAALNKGARVGTIKRWRNNGVTYSKDDDSVGFMLHNTEIVNILESWPHGHTRITLDTGGHNTVTTRRAMNEVMVWGAVYQRKHRLYFDGVEFYQRIVKTVSPDGVRYHSDATGITEHAEI